MKHPCPKLKFRTQKRMIISKTNFTPPPFLLPLLKERVGVRLGLGRLKNKHMKSNLKLFALLIFCLPILGSNLIVAQALKLNAKGSSMTISGTTNVHDWKSKVTQITAVIVFNSDKKVQSMSVDVPVKSIKSDESLMDKKTYEAFNADKNPAISFRLTEVNSMQISGSDISVAVTGNLTMAGVTRKISLKSTGKILKPGVYEFKGSVALKMTDFGMKPPTALMGVMKVGDGVNLSYTVLFEGPEI